MLIKMAQMINHSGAGAHGHDALTFYTYQVFLVKSPWTKNDLVQTEVQLRYARFDHLGSHTELRGIAWQFFPKETISEPG